jgi:hypothetical protein
MVAAFKQTDLFRGLQNDLSHLNACVGDNAAPTISTITLGDISKAPDCF